jgi:hypothetical protein
MILQPSAATVPCLRRILGQDGVVTEEVRTWSSKLYYKISNKRTGFAPLIEREDSGQCFQWYWADHQVVESWSIYVLSCILEQHMLSTIT